MKIQNLPGTRDFYPKEMRQLNSIFSIWRNAAEKYGYAEVDGPLLETAELWKEKAGELPQQMYSFTDKGDREVAIRPEFTPTLARMIAQKQKEITKPIRWYGIIRCWRYERPQSGRLREFFQLNVDCAGTESMKADAEIIAITTDILKQLKITPQEAYIRISNRQLMKALLEELELEESRMPDLMNAIDKKDKLTEEAFEEMLKDIGLKQEQIFGLKDILNITQLAELEKLNLNKDAKKALQDLKELFNYLRAYGIEEYCELDLTIIRGLDYYTGTVFEVFDRSKKFRAIAGGGRYDNLVEDFGGERCPGVGIGMGDVVLQLFLKEKNKLPETQREVDYYVAPITEAVAAKAAEIAQKLRKKGKVEMDIAGRNLKKQMEYANAIGAKNVVIVGEKDLKEGKVTIKNMITREETQTAISDL